MRVVTDPDTSASLYNGEVKVILAAVDLAVVNGLMRLPERLACYSCATARREGEVDVLRIGQKRRPSRIPAPNPPTFCLAMLAASPAGQDQLERLRELWSGGGEGFLPRPVLIDPAAGPEAVSIVYQTLFEAALTLAGSSAARLLSFQGQFCAFRITHEQLQNAFDTVEAFLSRASLPPTWLAFASEPAQATVGPLDGNRSFRLTQLLPLPSQGLAAIELHTAHDDTAADGVLNISVIGDEDARCLGEWAIPYALVPHGWLFLDLPEIDIAPRQTAVLSAAWNTRSGRAPTLSLTSWQPEPEACVRIEDPGAGGDAGGRSLAVRLHVGLPGSRRIAHPFQIGVMRQTAIGSRGARLAPSVLRRFAVVAADTHDEARARFLEETGAIELRPVNGASTVAKLAAALPPHTRRLTATIKTEDPAGPLVEYALLALAPDEPHEPYLRDGLANASFRGFSGWLPIHPDFTTQIHLVLSRPAIEPLDLYLAVRLVPGQIAQSALTRWLEFVIDSFPESMAA